MYLIYLEQKKDMPGSKYFFLFDSRVHRQTDYYFMNTSSTPVISF